MLHSIQLGRGRSPRGQSTVEFALSVPLLLLLLFAMLDVARVFQAYVTVYHAAREGARYASTGRQELVNGSYLSRTDSIVLRTKESLAGLSLHPSPDTVNAATDGWYSIRITPQNAGLPGEYEEVEVSYSVVPMTPALSIVAPYFLLSARQRVINEYFGAVPKLDRANVPPTPVPLPTFTPVPTPTPMPTPTPQPTPTATPTPPPTSTPTAGPTPTATPTP